MDLQNKRQLTIKIPLLFMVCLLGFWLRNAPLVKVVGNPIADGNVFKIKERLSSTRGYVV